MFQRPVSEPHFKVLIAKFRKRNTFAIQLFQINAGQRHAVKCVIFHGGVYGHILNYHALSDLQRRIEALFTDHIARQTAGPAQTIGKCFFTLFAGISQRRAIGHFQHIRHMARSTGIHNGNVHAVVH